MDKNQSRKRKALKVACSVAATTIALELLLRLVMASWEFGNLYEIHPGDGRCIGLRPGVSVTYEGTLRRIPEVQMEVNPLGYRGPEISPERARGMVRIATVGDSFTYGMGVQADQTFAAFLQKSLESGGSVPVEVLNFGMPGLDLPDIGPQIGRFISRWHPDLVVYFMEAGDLVMQGGKPRSLCKLAESSATKRALLIHCYLCRMAYLPIIYYEDSQSVRQHVDRRADAAAFRQLLDAVRHEAASAGAALLLVVLSPPELRDGNPMTVTDELGIPSLVISRQATNERIPNEGHYNPTGTRMVGEEVAAWLLKSGRVARSSAGAGQ